MQGLFLGLLGFAITAIVFVGLIIAAIVIFRRRSAGSGYSTPGSPNLLGTITQNKFARGLGIAVFLTVVYVLLLWLGYHFTAGTLVRQLGTEKRWAFLLVTVLGLPLIEVIWWLYKVAGIPGESKIIGRSFRTLAVFILIFLGWWYHDQPNRSFDVKSGKAIFYWAEKEKKPYFFDPGKETVPKVYFSPVTGETLRLGTPQDAERFRKNSWLPKTAKNLLSSSGISSAAQSQEEISPTETVIETIAPVGEWSEAVSIPYCTWFRFHNPTGDIWAKRLWDGKVFKIPSKGFTPLGDNIMNRNFEFKSAESTAVVVEMIYRSR